ncbi:MAG: alpha-galactosidase [Candidatus Hydrogenedens sp.]
MKVKIYQLYLLSFCLLFALMFLSISIHAETSRRSIASLSTDLYEVHLFKNGTIKVFFANGLEVLSLESPSVVYADSDEIVPLKLSGLNWYKEPVSNPLGDGIGLYIQGKNLTWVVEIYPGKPFFTVRYQYLNNSKKEQKIRSLISVHGTLNQYRNEEINENSIVCLGNGNIFESMMDFPQWVNGFDLKSQWNLAIYDRKREQSLLAGFLTCDKAYGQITLARNEKKKTVQIKSESVFDAPIQLLPGKTINAEVLYFSLGEQSPHNCLERYGRAIAVMNKLSKNNAFLPHGWDSWSTALHKDVNENVIMENIQFVDTYLKKYGWNQIAIDAGWERGPADWEPHPEKFPHGLKPIVEELHNRGMKAGLWIDLFTIPVDSKLAKEYSEWLVSPDARGKLLLGKDKKVLDVTIPEAYNYVRDTCKKISHEWGFDGIVEADFVYHLLLGEKYKDESLTKLQVLRKGLEAIREGLGNDKFLMTMLPINVSGMYADGIRIGFDNKPLWSSPTLSGNWGCVESLNNFARRYYLFPHLGVPDQDCIFLGHPETNKRWNVPEDKKLTQSQIVAWITGTALTGGVFKIGEEFTNLSPYELNVLKKIIPKSSQSARPVDLFDNPYPQIWSLPLSGPMLDINIVAVFNWDTEKNTKVSVFLEKLGLDGNQLYTLYDFWNENFVGIIQNAFIIDLPPTSVSLYGIRPVEKNPIFVASNHHITQGVFDIKDLKYSPINKEMTGVMKVIEDTEYKLTFFDPEKRKVQINGINFTNVSLQQKEGIITLQFITPKDVNELKWSMMFD